MMVEAFVRQLPFKWLVASFTVGVATWATRWYLYDAHDT